MSYKIIDTSTIQRLLPSQGNILLLSMYIKIACDVYTNIYYIMSTFFPLTFYIMLWRHSFASGPN